MTKEVRAKLIRCYRSFQRAKSLACPYSKAVDISYKYLKWWAKRLEGTGYCMTAGFAGVYDTDERILKLDLREVGASLATPAKVTLEVKLIPVGMDRYSASPSVCHVLHAVPTAINTLNGFKL